MTAFVVPHRVPVAIAVVREFSPLQVICAVAGAVLVLAAHPLTHRA